MSTEAIKINVVTQIKITRHKNGKMESKTSYVNGKNHGIETGWYDDGTKRWREMWRRGKEHGVGTYWYNEGTKWAEGMWMDGKRHGAYTMRYPNGQKEWEIYHLDNEPYAKIEWNEEGDVTKVNFPNTVINPLYKQTHSANCKVNNQISTQLS